MHTLYKHSIIAVSALLAVHFGLAGCASGPVSPSQESKENLNPKKTYEFEDGVTAGGSGPAMILIPAGDYAMGDLQGIGGRDEYPVHTVDVGAFAIGKYEVTIAEFNQFINETQYKTDAETGNGCYAYSAELNRWDWLKNKTWRNPNFSQADNHPVVCISWNDAVAYTHWLSQKTGEQYRLPTEAEWEYATRAGTQTNYSWGNEQSCENANCCVTGTTWMIKQTLPVGSFVSNAFGLHDTHGNVWEWTQSSYSSIYEGQERETTHNINEPRALRGGSWFNLAYGVRSSSRLSFWPQERYSTAGFRVARDVSEEFVKMAEQTLAKQNAMLSRLTP